MCAYRFSITFPAPTQMDAKVENIYVSNFRYMKKIYESYNNHF